MKQALTKLPIKPETIKDYMTGQPDNAALYLKKNGRLFIGDYGINWKEWNNIDKTLAVRINGETYMRI